jgi:hypothetical protein
MITMHYFEVERLSVFDWCSGMGAIHRRAQP